MNDQPDKPADQIPPEESPLKFPTDFPIKVMGRREDGFVQTVVDIVLKHAPDYDASTVEMRASREARYLSVTCTIRATSRAQANISAIVCSATAVSP